MRPLWYSFGPYTLKNFKPAQKKGFCSCCQRPDVELVLALAVRIQGFQTLRQADLPYHRTPIHHHHTWLAEDAYTNGIPYLTQASHIRWLYRTFSSSKMALSNSVVSVRAPRWKMN